MRELKNCPFCNSPPETYFTCFANANGFPVFTANISCEKCEIMLSRTVEIDSKTDKASFTDMENTVNELVRKWNGRSSE